MGTKWLLLPRTQTAETQVRSTTAGGRRTAHLSRIDRRLESKNESIAIPYAPAEHRVEIHQHQSKQDSIQ